MKIELIFVLLGLELLVPSSKGKHPTSRPGSKGKHPTSRPGSNEKTIIPLLEKKGSHVEFQFGTLTELVLVEFPDASNMTLTKTSSPEIKPGYKYTNNGTLAVFEILKVTEDEAGRYKFDLHNASVDLLYYEVILANLSCSLDHADGLILKSHCSEVERDKVAVKCHLDLFPKAKLYFKFKWRTKYGKHGIMKLANASDTYVEAYIDDVEFERNDVFECSANTLHWSGNFSGENTLYAMNKTVKELTFYKFGLMHPENQRPVECQAVTSPSINCSYKWIYLGGSNITTFPGSILHEEDIKKEGFYECLASCAIKEHSPGKCVLLGDRFEFSLKTKNKCDCSFSSLYHSLYLLAFVVWTLIFIMLYELLNCRRFFTCFNKQNENSRIGSNTQSEGSQQMTQHDEELNHRRFLCCFCQQNEGEPIESQPMNQLNNNETTTVGEPSNITN